MPPADLHGDEFGPPPVVEANNTSPEKRHRTGTTTPDSTSLTEMLLADQRLVSHIHCTVSAAIGTSMTAVTTQMSEAMCLHMNKVLEPISQGIHAISAELAAQKRTIDAQKATIDDAALNIGLVSSDTKVALGDLQRQIDDMKKGGGSVCGSSSSKTDAISNPGGWQPRPGVAFVGGFPRDSSRHNIVACLKHMVKDCPAGDIKACWSPDKRWSNGRIHFCDDETLMQFVQQYRDKVNKTFTIGADSFDLWINKEKSLAKKNLDSKTRWAAQVLQEAIHVDVDQWEVCFLGRAIFCNRLRVASGIAKGDTWKVHDLSSYGLAAKQGELEEKINSR
jgi:hypothetical protein